MLRRFSCYLVGCVSMVALASSAWTAEEHSAVKHTKPAERFTQQRVMIAPKGRTELDSVLDAKFTLGGEVGRRLQAVTDQWILPAPYANPAMLEMFRDRDIHPYREQVEWAGEFAGKYLTHSVQIYRLTGDKRLREHITWFVKELASLQAEDGYLGPWPRDWRLIGKAPNTPSGGPWDSWGHYHIMLGMIFWYQATGDETALNCARRIGDLFCNRYLVGEERLHDLGAHTVNFAPFHALCLLYEVTGEMRYLEMAREIDREFEIPPAGDFVRRALAGDRFIARWETLYSIEGFAELYRITGDNKYKEAFERIWWSIVQDDRHNTGGFGAGEQSTGDPYNRGAIETCGTVAWMALSVDMLRLTGSSVVADELELTTLNSGIGMMSPSGRWVTYDTPMDGRRLASAHHIAFQCRPGAPELNCCSVNGPRALGIASDWSVMHGDDGLYLNYYGPGTIESPLRSGNVVTLKQDTDYPRNNRINLTVKPRRAERFVLALRVPYWSEKTSISVNAKPVSDVSAGRYLKLNREWKSGDHVTIDLDFRLHCWYNESVDPHKRWAAMWKVFGPIPNLKADHPGRGKDILPGDTLQEMPESIVIDGKALLPIEVKSEDGIINLRELFPRDFRSPIAHCFTEIESENDNVLPIVFNASGWMNWYVNGVKVYDNHETWNTAPANDPIHRLDLPLRKGKNLVSVRVTADRFGWDLIMGRRTPSSDADMPFRTDDIYQASIYRGPILLTYDPRFNYHLSNPGATPIFNTGKLTYEVVDADSWLKPWLLVEFKSAGAQAIRLCDFGSAGAAGGGYSSWLPMRFPVRPKAEFSRENPLRSFRL